MSARTFAVRFDFPEATVYAGLYQGACGFAPSVATAMMFTDANVALATLTNGYGPARAWGRVVPVTA